VDHSVPPQSPQTFALSRRRKLATSSLVAGCFRRRDASRALARLIIERGGRIGKEFPITALRPKIGRWDADSGIFPDVDLDEDDPKPRSREGTRASLITTASTSSRNLGSTNGTFVNRGRRLLPGKRHMLQNGDEVIVGKTFLKFQILK